MGYGVWKKVQKRKKEEWKDKYIKQNKDKYIAKGKAEGEKLGMANALLEIAKNMLKDGFPIEKIMQITKLSLADIKAISL